MKFFKIKVVLKKTVVFLLMVVFVMSFTGCNKSANNTEEPVQEKIVEIAKMIKISSNPEGATVLIDDKKIDGVTPVEHSFLPGTHKVYIEKGVPEDEFVFIYEGTINVTNDKKVQTISATLEKRVQGSTATIRFDDKPEFSMGCNPLRDFAGIYLNETVKISGVTYLNSLDLAFPSGKKVHFDTEKTEFKYVNGKDVRKFSKTVTFDEAGEYKIFSNGEIVTPGAGGYREYKFKVLYKAEPIDTLTLGNLNGN